MLPNCPLRTEISQPTAACPVLLVSSRCHTSPPQPPSPVLFPARCPSAALGPALGGGGREGGWRWHWPILVPQLPPLCPAVPGSLCPCARVRGAEGRGSPVEVSQQGLAPTGVTQAGKRLPACSHAHTLLKAALAFAQQLREIWGFSLCVILWGYLC